MTSGELMERWYPGARSAWTQEMRDAYDRWRDSPEAKAEAQSAAYEFAKAWTAGDFELDVLRSESTECVITQGPAMNRAARRAAAAQARRR